MNETDDVELSAWGKNYVTQIAHCHDLENDVMQRQNQTMARLNTRDEWEFVNCGRNNVSCKFYMNGIIIAKLNENYSRSYYILIKKHTENCKFCWKEKV